MRPNGADKTGTKYATSHQRVLIAEGSSTVVTGEIQLQARVMGYVVTVNCLVLNSLAQEVLFGMDTLQATLSVMGDGGGSVGGGTGQRRQGRTVSKAA
ncbi:hypothetical protein KM043_014440 [Ampulex compressa]|nr:hypothetical protein KM043_014440 [Ampulex compressa]